MKAIPPTFDVLRVFLRHPEGVLGRHNLLQALPNTPAKRLDQTLDLLVDQQIIVRGKMPSPTGLGRREVFGYYLNIKL